MMPKVSIIVPVYNAEKVLRRCLDSILNQSYKDFELIVINDGSKDKSIKIINEYKEKDNRVKVIDNKNNGVSETRNIGIKASVGEYIQFIDSDDYIEPYMIEETLIKIEENKADSIITGLFLDIESNTEIKSSKQTFEKKIEEGKKNIAIGVMERLNGTYINSPVNKIYKRSIIVDNNIYMDKRIDLGEDLLLNLEYFKHCKKVIFDDKCYYHYCMQVEDNLTFKYRSDKLELMYLIYCKCNEYFNTCNIDNKMLMNLNNIFIKWMYSCFIDLHNNDCKLSIKEELRYIKVSIERYNYIISRTGNMILMLRILKATLRYSWSVWLLSKIIYIIKVKFRQILYR